MKTPETIEAQKVVTDFVGQNIDLLVKHLNEYCTKNKTQFVPIDYLKNCAESVKVGFENGVQKANENETPNA